MLLLVALSNVKVLVSQLCRVCIIVMTEALQLLLIPHLNIKYSKYHSICKLLVNLMYNNNWYMNLNISMHYS